jgi:2-polyprenyl-3-methyl-5-hydroxy-6-metoxy-1,4-benzoquinol methylase
MSPEKRDFDKEAATWDQEARRLKLASDVAQSISEAVKLDHTMDVLDFGCGTGLLTLELHALVCSITGIDSSAGMLDALKAKIENRKLTNVQTHCLDLEKGARLPGTYDLVVSSMTLHHIKEIGPLLGELAGTLRPEGHLCIAELAPDGGQFHSNNEGVFHFGFPEAELRRAFAESGLTDLRYRTAAEVAKPLANGGEQAFKVFLMIGRK